MGGDIVQVIVDKDTLEFEECVQQTFDECPLRAAGASVNDMAHLCNTPI